MVFFPGGTGGGGTPHRHRHKESHKDLNLKKGSLRDTNNVERVLEEHDCIINYLLRYISLFGEGGSPLYEDAIMIG